VIPPPSVDRLLAVGRWLETNGDGVYGTRPGPVHGLDWCRTTAKPGRTYLHVFDWPAGAELRLPDVGHPVARARLLADPARELTLTGTGGETRVQGPAQPLDPADTVVVLEHER
jgi:alpha-L-fucosidase